MNFSNKGEQLLKLYEHMAQEGYDCTDGAVVEASDVFRNFELRHYRQQLKQVFKSNSISTVLDYGCGGSDWTIPDFDESGQSATDYFELEKVYRYEPARNLDERQKVDCVVSFDVLEHIFISDVPSVIRDMFSLAENLLVLNVACYAAAAKLPNGENAHVTVRNPAWWKGLVDGISIEYPKTSVLLICSVGWRNSSAGPIWKADEWQNSTTFVVN